MRATAPPAGEDSDSLSLHTSCSFQNGDAPAKSCFLSNCPSSLHPGWVSQFRGRCVWYLVLGKTLPCPMQSQKPATPLSLALCLVRTQIHRTMCPSFSLRAPTAMSHFGFSCFSPSSFSKFCRGCHFSSNCLLAPGAFLFSGSF